MARKHIPMSGWCIVACANCGATLRSPFPPKPEQHDPGGMGTFAMELAREIGADEDEISTTEVARAWARAFGWSESDEWHCPEHAPAADVVDEQSSTVVVDMKEPA